MRRVGVFVAAWLSVACAFAAAQQAIPLRTLTPPVASSVVFRGPGGVRALANGSVIVDDGTLRRVVLLDSTLTRSTTIADSASGAPQKYSLFSGLIPFTGDSTLYLDYDGKLLVVIDPAGKVVRAIAPPKVSDLRLLRLPGTGLDARGRLVYRATRALKSPAARAPFDGAGKMVISENPDSAPIVRGDFESRAVDTAALMATGVSRQYSVSYAVDYGSGGSVINPFPVTDEWTLLPDGTIAIVRARDYHIDWIDAAGKVTSTPKMPFDWKRFPDEEKRQILDSLKAAGLVRYNAALEKVPAGHPEDKPNPTVFVDAADLPDYYPPIRAGQVKADADGHVWILPSTTTLSEGSLLTAATAPASGLVYDVVNRVGVIVERVRIPEGRSLVAFGPGGVVYMTHAIAPQRVVIERARVVRP